MLPLSQIFFCVNRVYQNIFLFSFGWLGFFFIFGLNKGKRLDDVEIFCCDLGLLNRKKDRAVQVILKNVSIKSILIKNAVFRLLIN